MKKPTEKFRIPRIAALIHSDALASSVTLPMELSMAAAQTAGQLIPNENNVLLVSENGGQVTTSGGLKVETQAIDTVGRLDLLVISAIWRDPKRVLKETPFISSVYSKGGAVRYCNRSGRDGKFSSRRNGSFEPKSSDNALVLV